MPTTPNGLTYKDVTEGTGYLSLSLTTTGVVGAPVSTGRLGGRQGNSASAPSHRTPAVMTNASSAATRMAPHSRRHLLRGTRLWGLRSLRACRRF